MTTRVPRWNGWGHDERPTLGPAARRELVRRVGPGANTPPVPMADVVLPESRLPAATRRRLAALLSADGLRTGRVERIRHAAGRGYLDLLRLRSGALTDAPDAVLYPADADQVAAVLERCAADGVAVVPFGGGTSVVGGVTPHRAGTMPVVTLDLARLDRLVDVDRLSQTATLQAGMRGPEVEAALARHGYTLGHFPQSFQFATLGGWVATRSAGQASTGYGRIDDLVHAVHGVTPAGVLRLGRGPASAAGPRLRDVLVGSEGTLGVITAATLAVRPRPQTRHYEGWSLPNLPAGLAAFRALAQRLGGGLAPDVCRLSDPDETHTSYLLADSAASRLARGYLSLRGHRAGCLAVLGWEGDPEQVRPRRRAATRLLHGHGGVSLGTAPGRSWYRGRFDAPNLRDTLLDNGLLVETLETAADWSRLPTVYEALRATLRAHLGRVLVMTHVSHLYRTGASLYLTVLAARDLSDPYGQWRRAKQAATAVLVEHGATITHHHAVGTDHRDLLPAELGDTGVDLLRGIKSTLDPSGIMNPAVLVPPGTRRHTS